MKNTIIGLVLLAIVVAAGWYFWNRKKMETEPGGTVEVFENDAAYEIALEKLSASTIPVRGMVGGEKIGFLKDPQVRYILAKRYGLRVDYTKAGSIEMVRESRDAEFLWPSSQVALELYRMEHPGAGFKSDVIFNSPIVLYSRDRVTDALMKQGIVAMRDSSYYVVDFPLLMDYVLQKKKWSEIGLPEYVGSITVTSTDPTRSNSGNMFAGLFSGILNNQEVVTPATLEGVLPRLVDFFVGKGFLLHSSGDLFNKYIEQGPANPIIVGYENQIVEFSLANQKYWPLIRQKLRILYPEPTVWSAHPLIALSPEAQKLLKALEDEELQRIAWERHGFRSGMIGVQNDPRILAVAGIPEQITSVLPMPSPQVMDRIIDALEKAYQSE